MDHKRAEDNGLFVDNDFGDDFEEDEYEEDEFDNSGNKDNNIFENSRTKEANNKKKAEPLI